MKKKYLVLVILTGIFLISGCLTSTEKITKMPKKTNQSEVATFAGGCFWCMEAAFEGLHGIVDVVSGYSGGKENNPTYTAVSMGKTSHKEAIQIKYDPKKITYQELLDLFWKQIDPTDDGGQFVDRGPQYRTAIFYHNQTQKQLAEKSKVALTKSSKFDKPIVTEILSFDKFYLAEEYHQDYSKKRTLAYKIYEKGSGRPQYKKKVWEVK